MTKAATRGAARQKRHERIRLRLEGTSARPRLAVFRSLNHIYAQVIDDASGQTLAAASSLDTGLRATESTKTEDAKRVGQLVADALGVFRLRALGRAEARVERGRSRQGLAAGVVDDLGVDVVEAPEHGEAR